MVGKVRQPPEVPSKIKPVGKGYAIWLVPEEPMFSRLAERISWLSREYSTPRFDPHVTLLSGITGQEREIRAKSDSLASSLEPIRAELDGLGYLDEYFRCLFIKVVPSSPIIKAHRKAREALGMRSESACMPHLSLMYGSFRLETKKKIAADLGPLAGQPLGLEHLKLYRVSGPPDEWKCVEVFDLRYH